jgi:hypothetical protein
MAMVSARAGTARATATLPLVMMISILRRMGVMATSVA